MPRRDLCLDLIGLTAQLLQVLRVLPGSVRDTSDVEAVR